MISNELKGEFEKIIEIEDINWSVIDYVAISDANILRPIKGISFEVFLKKMLKRADPTLKISDGIGDSDVDLTVNRYNLQVKTPNTASTKYGYRIGISLHKTHGQEKRPFNLYDVSVPTFDFLVFPHPEKGICIVPYDEIPSNKTYEGYLDDPAIFEWNNEWINRWELIGLDYLKNIRIDDRTSTSSDLLPNLCRETNLEDYEIIEMLCEPQYFRAAVMGLKGNIKEFWFINELKTKYLLSVSLPTVSYAKYDLTIKNIHNKETKVQVKGTSKNMCSLMKSELGFEIMGTHGQFPERGYKADSFDYVAVIISNKQLPEDFNLSSGLHFVFIKSSDLPLHYLIGNGDHNKTTGTRNERWNLPEFNNVLYPNIKLRYRRLKNGQIELFPAISSYQSGIISNHSRFRNAGPFYLDQIPDEFLVL